MDHEQVLDEPGIEFTIPTDGGSTTAGGQNGLHTHGLFLNFPSPPPGLMSYVTNATGGWNMWTGLAQTAPTSEWDFLHLPPPPFVTGEWYTATVQTLTEDILTQQCVFQLVAAAKESTCVVAKPIKRPPIRPDPATKDVINIDPPKLSNSKKSDVKGYLKEGHERHYLIALIYRKTKPATIKFAATKKTGEQFRMEFPQGCLSDFVGQSDCMVRVLALDPTIHPREVAVTVEK